MKKWFTPVVSVLLLMGGGDTLAQGKFVHPGLMHSEQDFERIREGLRNNDPQVAEAFAVLRNCWIHGLVIDNDAIAGVYHPYYANSDDSNDYCNDD